MIGKLADTSTDLPGLSGLATDADDIGSPPEVAEMLQGSDEDDSPSVEIPLSVKRDLMAVLWPLTVFVLAPLALVGAVGLLWVLVRTAIH